MEDSRAGSGPGPGSNSEGAPGAGQSSIESLIGALTSFMEQQRTSSSGQGATKALKGVVDKIGRFDGKNITKFLRVYVCEMEVYQVPGNTMIQTFPLAVVPEIRARVQELRGQITSWPGFEERLRDEYFDEDIERITRRSFLDWIEQQPGKLLGPNELLREFEKKFNQLPLAERHLLEPRKAEMFLQAADDSLEDRLLLLLGDRNTEGGFTNDWRRVEETVILVAKQQRVRARGIITRADMEPVMAPRAPATVPSTSKTNKGIPEDTLEDLIKGFKELKVEMSALRRDQRPKTSRPNEGSKGFVMRCIFCDDPSHKRGECDLYADALKEGIITFREGKIRDATTDEPLETNFGRGGMKKLIEERLGKTSFTRARGVNTYHIGAGLSSVEASLDASREVMIRGAEAIRELTGWKDPVDITTIKAFLVDDHGVDLSTDASVEVKRGRAPEEEEPKGPASKKKPPNTRAATPVEGPTVRMHERDDTRPSTSHPSSASLPKGKWEERVNKEKEKEKKKGKEDVVKGKGRAPAYKLQSDIESSTDLKGILEERILDAKIEFTLREALGIAKKDFHELIIDIIKRKRQMTAETVMMKALDTHMTEDEEEEIGQVFAMMCDCMDGQGKGNMAISSQACEETGEETEDLIDEEMEGEVLQMFACGCVDKLRMEPKVGKDHQSEEVEAYDSQKQSITSETICEVPNVALPTVEANVSCCLTHQSLRKYENEAMTTYTHPFWARATTETRVKIGDLDEFILALVDHGSEINIISRNVYEKGKWPIDVNHGWVMRAATNERGNLYGACPAIKTKIGDVEVEQNFFVQNRGSYPIILGQPYITATRMETKVLDDGSHYARIRSLDGKRAVQFLTVKPKHERHRDQLREAPLSIEDYQDF